MFPEVTLLPMPTARPYHHGHLRDAVLDAARRMVSSTGTAGLSLRALAREVGVSHPALYNHFRDRDALLAELSTEALLALARSQRQALAKATSPMDGLLRLSTAYFRFGVSDPARLRLAFAPTLTGGDEHRALRAAADAAEAPSVEALTRAADAGFVPRTELRERSVALWALVHGYTTLAIDGRLSEGRVSVDGAGYRKLLRALHTSIQMLLQQV
jgi:AcrR family transcriptional regulator